MDKNSIERKNNRSNKAPKGFTMVELIVVLVIITILAAVAIPALLGFIDHSRDKQYIADAEASLKATQAALTEVYNNASNRLHPDRREEAHKESGTAADSSFKVWTTANLQDGETEATSDNIASYTVAYALYEAGDGTCVFYNGKTWEICKNKDKLGELDGYGDFAADNVIYMWTWQHDTAYDPQPHTPDDNEFAEDIFDEETSGIKITFVGREDMLTFGSEGDETTETSVEYDASKNGTTDFPTAADQINHLIAILNALTVNVGTAYDDSTLKWVCTVGDGDEAETVESQNFGGAVNSAITFYNDNKIPDGGEIVFTASLDSDAIEFTAIFAAYDPNTQLIKKGESDAEESVSLVFSYDMVTEEITCGDENIEDMNLDALISGVQNTQQVTDDGVVGYSNRWLLYTGEEDGKKTYEKSGSSFKEYSLNDGAANNVKAYIEACIDNLANNDEAADSARFETPADLYKTVHFRAYKDNLTDDNGNPVSDDFDPEGSIEQNDRNDVFFNDNENENVISVDYSKNEIDDTVKAPGNVELAVIFDDYDTDGDSIVDTGYSNYKIAGYSLAENVTWEAKYNGERFKFWVISDSDKSGVIDAHDPDTIKARPIAQDGPQRECINVILAKLFAEDNYHFGEVAEIDLSDINALLINNDTLAFNYNATDDKYEVDVTGAYRNQPCILRSVFGELSDGPNGRISGLYSSNPSFDASGNNIKANTKVKLIKKIGVDEAKSIWNGLSASQKSDSRQMCISVTELEKISDYKIAGWSDAQGNALFDFNILNEDPEYPAYVVAFSYVDTTDGKTCIYVFSEDDCYVKAKSTFQFCFKNFTELKEVGFVEYIDTSDVTRLKGMFQECKNLKKLNISNLSAQNTTDTTYMFKDCLALEDLHIENLNTSKTIHFFDSMFCNCEKLKAVYTNHSPDGGTIEGGKVSIIMDIGAAYNLQRMFAGCKTLESVTLVGNGMDNPTPLGANNRVNAKTGNNCNIDIFCGCTSLKSITFKDLYVTNNIMLTPTESDPNPKVTKILSLQNFFIDDTEINDVSNISNDVLKNTLETVVFDNCSFYDVESLDSLYKNYDKLARIDMSGLSLNSGESVSAVSMFEDCDQLIGNESDFNIKGDFYFTNTASMFKNCTSLSVAQPYEIDTTRAATMNNMYEGCTSISGSNTVRIDSANNISNMLLGCESITEVTLSGGSNNIAPLNNVKNVFEGCDSLNSIKLDSIKSSLQNSNLRILFHHAVVNDGKTVYIAYDSVTSCSIEGCEFNSLGNLNDLFSGNETIKNFKISNSSFSHMTQLKNMFKGCLGIESVIFDGVTMSSSGVDATSMFENCTQLTGVGDITSFKLSDDGFYVLNATNMFRGCTGLVKASPYDVDTSQTKIFDNMYYGCSNTGLTKAEVRIDVATSIQNMFYGCTNLSEVTFEGGSQGENKVDCPLANGKATNVLNDTNISELKFKNIRFVGFTNANSDNKETGLHKILNYNNYKTKLTKVIFDNVDAPNIQSAYQLFAGAANLKYVDVSGLNMENNKSTRKMFEDCTSLVGGSNSQSENYLNVSGLVTANVTNMSSMFNHCYRLHEVDVSSFNTSNVTHMGWVFNSCYALETLDLSSFDTRKCTNFTEMFWDQNNNPYATGDNKKLSQLRTIYVSDKFVINNSSTDMFGKNLLYLSGPSTSLIDMQTEDNKNFYKSKYAVIDGKNNKKGYFTEKTQ